MPLISSLMILFGGFLGSTHCIGMCGGFAATLGSGAPSVATNLLRQLTYSFGRIFTYAVCGAAAGYGGLRLILAIRPLADLQAWMSVAAGIVLVVIGLHAAGILRSWNPVGGASSCLASTLFGAFLLKPGWTNVFLAGLLNGLLPCGLVY